MGKQSIRAGMTVSVRTRRDVVIIDPDRFLAAARAAFCELHPEATEQDALEQIDDVIEAVFILLERDGRLVADAPGPLIGAGGPLPGQRVLDRPDGLSPAGELTEVSLEEPQPLQDYGCFLPDDPFALPSPRGIEADKA